MRKKLIAGNWKMNKTPKEAKNLIKELLPLVRNKDVDVVFCVPFIDLPYAAEMLKGSAVSLGAQNMHFEEKGAYTGEISADMLYEIGTEYVIIGHSERRTYFAETDETVNKKLKVAIDHDLIPILCCGESLEQREADQALEFIGSQIFNAFDGIDAEAAANVVIAYEPIWAIGTGKVATPEQAEDVCSFIRGLIGDMYGEETASEIHILYGGSVTGKNAAELFSMEDIDGALVGGASLKADFGAIVNYNRQ